LSEGTDLYMGSGDVKRQEEGCSHRKKHPHLDKPARISSQSSLYWQSTEWGFESAVG
jgi:hypothetical protein